METPKKMTAQGNEIKNSESTPKEMVKGIINASFGHIDEKQTFTTKPPKKTENTTMVEDIRK